MGAVVACEDAEDEVDVLNDDASPLHQTDVTVEKIYKNSQECRLIMDWHRHWLMTSA